jgi:hypothetical protein
MPCPRLLPALLLTIDSIWQRWHRHNDQVEIQRLLQDAAQQAALQAQAGPACNLVTAAEGQGGVPLAWLAPQDTQLLWTRLDIAGCGHPVLLQLLLLLCLLLLCLLPLPLLLLLLLLSLLC